IGFLFILFECLPVFVKLMSNKGPYDFALQDTEESAIHGSFKGKDYNIAVTDGIQETKVDTEVEKQKEIIKKSSVRDLKEYDWEA
ncbi:MAG: DUF4407 domain-containing protein, partial [Flavobacterium sp.]|nr:DUF4407 domain-containing protein [Pedobacter sp.]